MSKFKGTEEKWLRDGNLVFAEDYFQSHIASTCGAYNNDIEEANAQLISKAPEMLEMLREIRDQIEDGRTYITKQDITNLITEATTI